MFLNLFKKKLDIKKFLKRSPRFKVKNFHSLSLAIGDKKYSMVNISTTGIGIKHDHELLSNKLGEQISAQLEINNQSISVNFEIIFHGEVVTGVKIIQNQSQVEKFLREYFFTELLGADLKKIDPKLMKEVPEGIPRWFRGENSSNELFFVEHDGKILNFHIHFDHYFFQKDKFDFFNLGQLSGDQSPNGQTVDKSAKIPKESFEQVYRFLDAINDLEESHKNLIIPEVQKMYSMQWES